MKDRFKLDEDNLIIIDERTGRGYDCTDKTDLDRFVDLLNKNQYMMNDTEKLVDNYRTKINLLSFEIELLKRSIENRQRNEDNDGLVPLKNTVSWSM